MGRILDCIHTVNLKKDYPNSDYAIFLLEEIIIDVKRMYKEILIVIHGYGSHGKRGGDKRRNFEMFTKIKKRKTNRRLYSW